VTALARPTVPVLLGLAALLVAPCPARASKPRIVLEQVDSSVCRPEGLVSVFLSDLELEGTVREPDPAIYRLIVDERPLEGPPVAAVPFEKTDRPLRVALVLQASPSFEPDLVAVKEGAIAFVRMLSARSLVSVLVYAVDVDRVLGPSGPAKAEVAIDALEARREGTDLALVEALRTALGDLVGGPAGTRRMVVVISDGLNSSIRREVFKTLGDEARRAGTPIHPIAFSPIDERGPLLNLGEIAKRSGGTLRWARRSADLKEQFVNLGRQVRRQVRLTFDVPDHCAGKHVMRVAAEPLRSNPIVVPAKGARSFLEGWRGPVFLGALGVLVLGLTGLAIALAVRRSRRAAAAAAPPAAIPLPGALITDDDDDDDDDDNPWDRGSGARGRRPTRTTRTTRSRRRP
jgi:hypothetical protein